MDVPYDFSKAMGAKKKGGEAQSIFLFHFIFKAWELFRNFISTFSWDSSVIEETARIQVDDLGWASFGLKLEPGELI